MSSTKDWAAIDGEAWAKLQERLDKEIWNAHQQSSIVYGDRVTGDPNYYVWKSFVDQLMFLQKTTDLHCYILAELIELFWLLDPSNAHSSDEVRIHSYLKIRDMLLSLYMPIPETSLSDERLDRLVDRMEDIHSKVDNLLAKMKSPGPMGLRLSPKPEKMPDSPSTST